MDQRILIPGTMYVGINPSWRGKNFATITAGGTDANAQGRKSTVDSYCRGPENAREVANNPLRGFRLMEQTGKSEWKVWDPRGFACWVDTEFLSHLITQCTLRNGEILEPCVWGRSRGKNILLNTLSETYQRAREQTRVANMSSKWKDARLGDNVTLQTGVGGVYLGRYHTIDLNWRHATACLKISEKPQYAILEPKSTWGGYNRTIHLGAGPKLAEIVPGTTRSAQEAEQEVNATLQDPKTRTSQSSRNWGWNGIALIADAKSKISLSLTLKEDDPKKITALLTKVPYGEYAIVRDSQGRLLIYYNYRQSSYLIDESQLAKGQISVNWEKHALQSLVGIEKVYGLEMKVDTSLGNSISHELA